MLLDDYKTNGYLYLPNFMDSQSLMEIEPIIRKFHKLWLINNEKLYKNGAINSHSLTSSKHLTENEKLTLFNFVSSDKILAAIPFQNPKFLNTQLFFDPKAMKRPNYWHRDIQYTDLEIDEQKKLITKLNVVHVRIPLKNEEGIALIPGTHRRWDTPQELQVRNSLKNSKSSDDLEGQIRRRLDRGDALIFSANMIHRGIYGNDRLTLDIIFIDDNSTLLSFRNKGNLPNIKTMTLINNPVVFE